MRSLLLVSLVVTSSLLGACKKEGGGGGTSPTGETGANTGTGTGTPGTEPPRKAPEGCNSDLSQPVQVDFTFTEKCSPYTVSSELYVDGFTLSIEAGTELRFKDGAALYVAYGKPGKVVVKGTAEKPVKFTGERKEAGAWKTVEIYERGEGSSIENVVFEYGGGDRAAMVLHAGDVSLTNVKFVAVKGGAVDVDSEKPLKNFSGVDLSQAGGEPADVLRLNTNSLSALGAGNVYFDGAVINLKGNATRELKMSAQGAPYRVSGELYVDAPEGKGSAVLTIEAGVTVQWAEDAALYVGYAHPGALKLLGTKEKPITFTRFGDDPKATPWKGLTLYSNARAPVIDFAVFEYMGKPNEEAIKFADARGLGKLTNSTFRHLAGAAIRVDNARAPFEAFDGNVFEDVAGAALDVPIALAHKLGPANKFGTSSVIVRETVEDEVTLSAIDGAYWGQGELYVNSQPGKTASLTLEKGAKLKMMENAALYVGYSGNGKLIANGVTIEALQGKWKGLHSYPGGTLELESVTLSGVQPDSFAIEADADSKGTLKSVTFKDVSKGLHNCSKSVTATGLKADKGVKAEEKCE